MRMRCRMGGTTWPPYYCCCSDGSLALLLLLSLGRARVLSRLGTL